MPILTALLLSLVASSAQVPAESGGTSASSVRVLSVASGTKGEARGGRYVILDPR
jgi:hypothetical protein